MPSVGSAWGVAVATLKAERRARIEAELSATAASLLGRLPAVETVVLTGAPADAIARDVERSATDLVVVGARGLSVVGRLLLGSVSESVLTHAASRREAGAKVVDRGRARSVIHLTHFAIRTGTDACANVPSGAGALFNGGPVLSFR